MMRTFPTVSRLGLGLGGLLLLHGASGLVCAQEAKRPSPTIPLPEHPRPDFERPAWVNLNGTWQFRFDAKDEGLAQGWPQGPVDFPLAITVPFPWGSPLSGVPDEARIGWYARDLEVP